MLHSTRLRYVVHDFFRLDFDVKELFCLLLQVILLIFKEQNYILYAQTINYFVSNGMRLHVKTNSVISF